MKVFVRTSDLTGDKPQIIATYDDASPVKNDVHGEGVTVLSLPGNALVRSEFGLPTLAANWRDMAEEPFAPDDQIRAVYGLVDLIIKHGTDVTKWPGPAKAERAKAIEKFEKLLGKK